MATYAKEEIARVRQAHPLEQYLPSRGFELKKVGQELVCKCPFHQDEDPSLNVNPAKQVWTCRTGCGGGDLFAFVQKFDGLNFTEAMEKLAGRPLRDSEFSGGQRAAQGTTPAPKLALAPAHPPKTEKAKSAPLPPPTATYNYTDAAGNEVCQALRYLLGNGKKTFRQRQRDPEGKWLWTLDGITEAPIYRLPAVLSSSAVWVVEGEKDVETLEEFGITATCNPMGAGKWYEHHSKFLAGKEVVLCGDNDDPGRAHMDAVEKSLAPHAKFTKRIHVPEGFKDLTDFIADAKTREAGMLVLFKLAQAAPEMYRGVELPLQSVADLEQEYRTFVKMANQRAVHFGAWLPRLGALRPVVPGELVFILANTGAGKTAALQNLAASIPHLPTLLFELELPGTLTFERFAALASGESARNIWGAYKADGTVRWRESGKLNHVHVCSKSGIKVSDIERVVSLAHLKTGKPPAVVMVDYVGLIHGEGKSRYERTSSVAEQLKVLAKRSNTVVICASQVSRDKDDPHAEVSIFGGKDSGSIENSSGLLFGLWRDKEQAGRAYLRVLKSTKGGSGLTVACDFHGATMQITEAKDQPKA